MTKLEMLFIRACKSENPDRRIDRLYRMFYYSQVEDINIARILLSIADKYAEDMGIRNLIDDLAPGNAWKYGCDENSNYYTKVRRIMTSRIQLTMVSRWGTEFILPAKWRK